MHLNVQMNELRTAVNIHRNTKHLRMNPNSIPTLDCDKFPFYFINTVLHTHKHMEVNMKKRFLEGRKRKVLWKVEGKLNEIHLPDATVTQNMYQCFKTSFWLSSLFSFPAVKKHIVFFIVDCYRCIKRLLQQQKSIENL